MNLQKALTGIYEDNDFNRKLGRVGQRYDHSSGHIVIDAILLSLKNEINDAVKNSVEYLQNIYDERGSGQKITASEAEFIRLNVIADMSIALSKYIKPTDTLVEVKKRGMAGGSIEIAMIVSRDGKNHQLNTDMIQAGGHNIQTLHYRYLTKTDLKPLNDDNVKKAYKDKINKLTKAEKLLFEIKNYEKRIQEANDKLKIESSKTEEQILQEHDGYKKYSKTTWKDIVERGADKNFDYKEENYNKNQEEYKQSILNFHKNIHIEGNKRNIIEMTKSKLKFEQKLKDLSK